MSRIVAVERSASRTQKNLHCCKFLPNFHLKYVWLRKKLMEISTTLWEFIALFEKAWIYTTQCKRIWKQCFVQKYGISNCIIKLLPTQHWGQEENIIYSLSHFHLSLNRRVYRYRYRFKPPCLAACVALRTAGVGYKPVSRMMVSRNLRSIKRLISAHSYWSYRFCNKRFLQWQPANWTGRLLSQPFINAGKMETVTTFGHYSQYFLLFIVTQTDWAPRSGVKWSIVQWVSLSSTCISVLQETLKLFLRCNVNEAVLLTGHLLQNWKPPDWTSS